MIVPTYETTCKEQEITINELRSINRTQENRINIQKEEIKALKEELSECIEFQIKYDIAIVKCAKLEQEIERLNNIIKEVKEYIESYMPNYDFDKTNLIKLLEILQGSDKE